MEQMKEVNETTKIPKQFLGMKEMVIKKMISMIKIPSKKAIALFLKICFKYSVKKTPITKAIIEEIYCATFNFKLDWKDNAKKIMFPV